MGKAKKEESGKGKKRAPSEAEEAEEEEVEELDYSKLGPDIAQHKKVSNYVFGFTLFAILGAIIVLACAAAPTAPVFESIAVACAARANPSGMRLCPGSAAPRRYTHGGPRRR